MIWPKLSRLQLKGIFAITSVTISFISCPTFLLAQPDGSISNSFSSEKPDPLPGRGTPPTDNGTGSRGDCKYKDIPPLTRLVGSNNLALTVNEYPTFWVYVPYTPREAPSGEFSLQDGDNDVYRTRFQLPATPGIVSISLASTTKPLQVGKTYRWYFEIKCPQLESSDELPASVTGVVRRVTRSSDLESELNAAKLPLERVATYARHHLWYETLTELAQLRLNKPQNPTFENAWVELLRDKNIGLEKIAQEPIIGSVTTSSPPK